MAFSPETTDYLLNSPKNCGVDYKEACDDYKTAKGNGESSGESDEWCGESDDKVSSQKRLSKASTVKSPLTIKPRNTIDGQVSGGKKSVSVRSRSMDDAAKPPSPGPRFEGLPSDLFKKKYKPDYPDELKMKTVCAPKRRHNHFGPIKNFPKAVFVPSDSSLTTLEQRAAAAKPNAFLNDPSPLDLNRLVPPIITPNDEAIVNWMEEYNIQMLFEYFLSLCVLHKPEDPWTYLIDLCEKMIEARTNLQKFEKLPRVLELEHIEAIFRIYDRAGNGFINLRQYKSALESMGLNKFSLNPRGLQENQITKDTFINEATDAIDNLLKSFMIFEGEFFYQEEVEEKIPSGSELRKSLEKTEASTGEYSFRSSGDGVYGHRKTGGNKDFWMM